MFSGTLLQTKPFIIEHFAALATIIFVLIEPICIAKQIGNCDFGVRYVPAPSTNKPTQTKQIVTSFNLPSAKVDTFASPRRTVRF